MESAVAEASSTFCRSGNVNAEEIFDAWYAWQADRPSWVQYAILVIPYDTIIEDLNKELFGKARRDTGVLGEVVSPTSSSSQALLPPSRTSSVKANNNTSGMM